jgi:hypothetical protein
MSRTRGVQCPILLYNAYPFKQFCLRFISTCKPEATWDFHSVKFSHLQNNLGFMHSICWKARMIGLDHSAYSNNPQILCVASLENHNFTPRTSRTRVSKLPVHLNTEGRPIHLRTEGRPIST